MKVWDHAVALYARAGVERACLALQDSGGQCVALLLWRLWAVDEGRPVDGALARRAAALARAWEDQVVSPLRAVRRALERGSPSIADDARAALREKVGAAERSAERVLLEALGALTPDPAEERETDCLSALSALATAWGAPAAREVLRPLVRSAAKGALADRDRSATP